MKENYEIVYVFLPNEPFGREIKTYSFKDRAEFERALTIIKNEPNKYELLKVREK